jgi:hypothetical protein
VAWWLGRHPPRRQAQDPSADQVVVRRRRASEMPTPPRALDSARRAPSKPGRRLDAVRPFRGVALCRHLSVCPRGGCRRRLRRQPVTGRLPCRACARPIGSVFQLAPATSGR